MPPCYTMTIDNCFIFFTLPYIRYIFKMINDNLQHQLNTLYDYWFTQYDFPDENGKPYRLNNGVMQTCEAISQNIPLGWQVKKLTAV